MEKNLLITNYGICVFSLGVVQDFLKAEKIRTKKFVNYFQNNEDKRINLLTNGVWLPFAPINSIQYTVKLQGCGEPFSDEWDKKFSFDGFNIAIKDSLWIADVGKFAKFDENDFQGKEVSVTPYYLGGEYQDGHSFQFPSGKYLLAIEGYSRKKELERPNSNYGFYLSLTKTEEFKGYNDPMQYDKYEKHSFNPAQG